MDDKMKVYLIEGVNNIGKTEFSSLLGKKLSKNKKTLIIGTKRSEKSNIEDYYDKAGMISYDIGDYFLDYVDLDTVINKAGKNLDFIISPLINSKYEIKKEDIGKLLENLSYDYVIFDSLDPNLLDQQATRVKILGEDQIGESIGGQYFFVNKVKEDFDERLFKDELLQSEGKYLGFVNKNGSYNNVLSNLLNEKEEPIESIGFFEKLKMKFKSWNHIYF